MARVEEQAARIDRLNRDLAALKRHVFGSRRERFVAGGEEENGSGEDVVVEHDGLEKEPTAEASCFTAPTSSPPRTSWGRQKRVIDQSIPREKVLHPLDERDVPPELWNDPRAKRFYRFVREEVELQEARVRVLEHYEEVIALDDEATGESRMLTASTPEPLIPRCYVGAGLLAYLVASRFADHIPYYREEDILSRVGFSIHRATQWRKKAWLFFGNEPAGETAAGEGGPEPARRRLLQARSTSSPRAGCPCRWSTACRRCSCGDYLYVD